MVNDTQQPFGTYALRKDHTHLLNWAQAMPVSWFGRRGALTLRKMVLLREPSIVDAVVDGLKLRLYVKDNVSERKFLFTPQFFDRLERDMLKETLKDGGSFVDVGANAGIYTLTAAALTGASGKVIAIEPNPVVLDRLKFNTTCNGFDNRISFEQSGISDTEGSFDLTLDDTNLGGSSLVMAHSARKINVKCYKLLAIVQKHALQKIDALKIDIEGAEDKVLIPFFIEASENLCPKLLILENSPADWKENLPAALMKAGYTHKQTTRMNQIWTRN